MDQIGYVIEKKENLAMVQVRRISACGGNCKSCGGSCDAPSIVVELSNELDASQGDYVEIVSDTRFILLSSLIVYGIPAAGMIAGIFLGSNWFGSEVKAFGLGLLFMIATFGFLWILDRKVFSRQKKRLAMGRVLGGDQYDDKIL
jgi:sigma-E factor negative regulatory protein RseC